ncbi:DinB family protein [Gottfriedia sp. NPDC057991]|uniref:DinB family protein n=1 Tax=Gottfriedia sp. NPDC057991 TaxID=3346298 RepID=UPI0036DF6AA6
MNFNLKEAIEVLERTPKSLESLLSGLSESWLSSNEGEGTWNVSEVIDHLIECEKTNWIPRLNCMLNKEGNNHFPPFDRFSHLKEKQEKSIEERLLDFKNFRTENIKKLQLLVDPTNDLELEGVHPDFGSVKLRELLSTWVVHDLTHVTQITRVMAIRYKIDVRPWIANLSILKQ